MGEQSVAFRAFNADLSGRLKQSFSESMGPTLQRMVGAVEELNQLLRAAEATKSDTIIRESRRNDIAAGRIKHTVARQDGRAVHFIFIG